MSDVHPVVEKFLNNLQDKYDIDSREDDVSVVFIDDEDGCVHEIEIIISYIGLAAEDEEDEEKNDENKYLYDD